MQPSTSRWRLRTMMALATTPLLVGTLICMNTRSIQSQAAAAYQYPYAAAPQAGGNRTLHAERKFYQQRIKRNPNDGLDRAALATVYLKLARSTGEAHWYTKATEMAQHSLANLPFQNAEAKLVLARVAEAQHDFATTLQLIDEVRQTQPDNPEALALTVTTNLALGRLPLAQQAAQQLVTQTPTLNTLTLQALVQVAQGQDELALERFQQALAAEEPGETLSSAKTRVLLGRLHAQRGRLQQAEDLYREALRIQPDYGFAIAQLAQLATKSGQYTAAAAWYTQLLQAPGLAQTYDHTAHQGLAQLKQLQGDQAAADRLWQDAATQFHSHHHPEAHSHHHHHADHAHAFGHRRELARLLLTRGHREDGPTALALMQAEVSLRRDAETLDTFAWALIRQGKLKTAQTVLQEALDRGTRDAKLSYRAAQVAAALGDQQQAQQHLQVAQAIDPTFNASMRQLWGLDALQRDSS